MNILLLGSKHNSLEKNITEKGENVLTYDKKLTGYETWLDEVDYIVSYGYREILKPSVIRRFPNRIINLHISYLPWNRGADPNLWSFLENTIKGVTIHEIDSGLDTGNIFIQEEIQVFSDDTLRTTYERLSKKVETLLIENWDLISSGKIYSIKQNHLQGTYHKQIDKEPYLSLLTEGWDTKVQKLKGKALEAQGGDHVDTNE
ncbi:formyltransferase family protein [Salibacterium sp. K-3]